MEMRKRIVHKEMYRKHGKRKNNYVKLSASKRI